MRNFRISRRNLLATAGLSATASILPGMLRAEAPHRGGRLTVAADSEPDNLNPAIVASNGVFFVASKIVEPLAEASYTGKHGLAPRLATHWEAADNGLSIAFHLREGVSWHDGQPFTSADVAFSAMEMWQTLQNLGSVVFRDLKTVDTPDDHIAVLRFSEPTPLQLIRHALPSLTSVVPKHAFKGTDIAQNPINNRPIGTGPFQFAEHRQGEYYRLVRNNSYWDKPLPYLQEIVYRVLPDRSAAASMLKAGEIDLAAFSAVPLADLKEIAQENGLAVVTKGYEASTYQLIIEINHRREELADLAVRQAIAHAIDKNYVVNTIFCGYATPATGPIPKTATEFYTSEVTEYAFDVAEANRLLDKAGYKRDGNGMRFSLKLLPAPYFHETRAFGVYLSEALAAIGIDATIVNHDAAAHIKAVYMDHTFDLAVAPPVFRGDPAISTTILVEGGIPDGVPFSNQGGYDNPKLDALIGKAATTLDEGERTDLYHLFQKIVTDDLPLINIVDWTFTSVARNTIHNIADNPRWAVSNWVDTWMG
ncbi:MAG TPA: ABC transporter substrate-binding protein [Rhizobiaceae bacterium]|nr:ABC transporter substrate-binding protein [Rhizobiaceae bacterium]